jgi:ABC-type branched-subunit amino acid transport system ATPase component
MSYIKEIALKNYRSFVDARCRLSPFTLIVGANNAGKSNLLRAVADLALWTCNYGDVSDWNLRQHQAAKSGGIEILAVWDSLSVSLAREATAEENEEKFDQIESMMNGQKDSGTPRATKHQRFETPLPVFIFEPSAIGNPEKDGSSSVDQNGAGVSWILDKWNSGAKAARERFARVVADLRRCVPEIEMLSFYDVEGGKRGVQVEQFGLPNPVPLSEVSDGTRLVLAILTLINLEEPPPVILLEDINRGLHPRLYQRVVEFLRTIANEGKTQILATTHDPYLIDEFEETPEAVVVVEKKEASSTLSNLDERLKAIAKLGAELEMPLGELWFSGSLGGVPGMKLPDIVNLRAV